MRAFGWTVLTLVFVDELLAMAAVGVWGHHVGGWLPALALPVVAVTVWWAFGSPKAPYGGPVRRPVAKVLVFTVACLALWDAGHPGWAGALLGFSVVVNGLAQLPSIRALLAEAEAGRRASVATGTSTP